MAPEFDVDAFLSRPLVARLATSGPTVRPIWFLWEDGCFWVLTGPWSRLREQLRTNTKVALVVDTCDLATGEALQVIATGKAELLPYDIDRGYRKLSRYLGRDETTWDERFRRYLHMTDEAQWVRIIPHRLSSHDLSFVPSGAEVMAMPTAPRRRAQAAGVLRAAMNERTPNTR